MKLVLLPGLDGTGNLFTPFVDALPDWVIPVIRNYPIDVFRSYDELSSELNFALADSEPYALLAESYSSPIAMRLAASSPPNLKALVICAGFAARPVGEPVRLLLSGLTPFLFSSVLRDFAIRNFLLGGSGTPELTRWVRQAVSSVRRDVLGERLRAVLTCNERIALQRITVPVLYLQAAKDRLIKRSAFARMQAIKSGIELSQIDGPHLILQAEPQKAAEVVVRFLADC